MRAGGHGRVSGRHRRHGPPVIATLALVAGAAMIVATLTGGTGPWWLGRAARDAPRVATASSLRLWSGGPRPPRARFGSRPTHPMPGPVRIVIPSIGVSAPLVRLGLNADRTLQVPSGFVEAGWYAGGATPGSPGPAVIVGHVDSRTGPAVFFRLRELEPESTVVVRMSDGGRRTFDVVRVAEVPKSAFPTAEVYGATSRPELRLITCGGTFDASTGHYLDNVVVFAVGVSGSGVAPPPA